MVQLVILLLVIIGAAQSFFLSNRDLRKIFKFFPTAFGREDRGYFRKCHHSHPVGHPDYDYHYHDDDLYYDRHLGGIRRNRQEVKKVVKDIETNPKLKKIIKETVRKTKCKDHEHDDSALSKLDTKSDLSSEKYIKLSTEDSHKGEIVHDDAKQEDLFDKDRLNYKKDYVAGVLLTIPQIKDDAHIRHYLQQINYHNPFFESLPKPDFSGSYLYGDNIKPVEML